MALTPMREDLNIISRLDDEPNDTQGLTPAELKARFDLAGNRIQAYINDTLLPEVEDAIESRVPASRRICGKTLERDVALTARDVGALPEDTPIPATLADLAQDPEHRTVTDAEKAAWNAKGTLALGETAQTAFRGDLGKTAYEHSQMTGNPHGTTPADIGAAEVEHGHGSITPDGKIGSAANQAVFTGEQGALRTGVLPVEAGGTGAATAAAARAALGAAAAEHAHPNMSVNGKALEGPVTLTAGDVGAVPLERRVNNKPLTGDLTLTLEDVPDGGARLALTPAERAKLQALEPYVLPVASAATLGGVRVGAGLSIDQNGVLSAVTASGDVPGDMVRAVYDPDGDGVVRAAEVAYGVDWENVANKPDIPATLAALAQDPEHRTVTDAEKAAWNTKSTLALGETASTAYRGDRGKIAYDHSQAAGNPHGTTPADIGAVPATRKVNGKPLSADVSLSASDVGAAAAAHVHGNLTSDGRIGSMAGRAVFTGEQGLLQAGVLPLSAGGTGASTAAAARAALGAAAFLAGTAVLEPGWTGPNGQGYYTRTVSAQGVLASDWVDVTRVLDLSDKSASDQVQAAWDKVAECAVGEGVLTFYAPEDINTAIPVAWKVVR